VLEIARQGSIYGAAKVLNVDHSTVTRRLAHVEHVFERQLFDRSSKGISPRQDTESIIAHIRMMEVHALAMRDELVAARTAPRTVRIATMEGLASGYLARRIESIAGDKDEIRIALFSNPHIVDLLKKETDIFLSFFDPKTPGLISEKVGDIAVYLYGSEAYAQRHGLPQSAADLPAHRYVSYIPEMVTIESVRWLEEILPEPFVVFCSNSVIAQRNAAESGKGLAALPVFVGEESQLLFRVLPEQISITRPVWISVTRDQHLIKGVRQTAKAIADVFAGDAALLMGREPWLLGKTGTG
jgi:DNA-binding transcriptional LysR family regulator